MNHADAVRMNATEKYLLNELDSAELDRFEEHMFDCQECALDVRAAAAFIDQSKDILAKAAPVPVQVLRPVPTPTPRHWLAWLRPAFTVPVMAALIAFIGYQNLVVYPGMKQAAGTPYLYPAVSINVATRSGATPAVHSRSGEPFLLLVNLPAESRFSSYIADLHDPAGRIEWSVPIAAAVADDIVPMRIPGQREAGVYTLAIRGVPQTGGTPQEIGRQPFELKLQ
jgi:putative zinc finger protein